MRKRKMCKKKEATTSSLLSSMRRLVPPPYGRWKLFHRKDASNIPPFVWLTELIGFARNLSKLYLSLRPLWPFFFCRDNFCPAEVRWLNTSGEFDEADLSVETRPFRRCLTPSSTSKGVRQFYSRIEMKRSVESFNFTDSGGFMVAEKAPVWVLKASRQLLNLLPSTGGQTAKKAVLKTNGDLDPSHMGFLS